MLAFNQRQFKALSILVIIHLKEIRIKYLAV
jgi:hypothetical protein